MHYQSWSERELHFREQKTSYSRQSYATALIHNHIEKKDGKERVEGSCGAYRGEVSLTLTPHWGAFNPCRFSITPYLQPNTELLTLKHPLINNTVCTRAVPTLLNRSRAQQSHCSLWAQKWEAETDGNGEGKWQAGCGTAELILPSAHIRIRPVCQLCASFCVGLHLHNSHWAKTKQRNRKNLGEGRDVWSL